MRVVFATIAFGMGVNVRNLYTVIHYGPSYDIDDYVQESGRVGRDGGTSSAILIRYRYALTGSRISKEMKEYVRNQTSCRRIDLYSIFPGDSEYGVRKHICCDICHIYCDCEECKSGNGDKFVSHAESELKSVFLAYQQRKVKIKVMFLTLRVRISYKNIFYCVGMILSNYMALTLLPSPQE